MELHKTQKASLGVPLRFWGATLQDFPESLRLTPSRNDEAQGITLTDSYYLVGSNGTGKSHWAAAMLERIVSDSFIAKSDTISSLERYWYTSYDILADFKSTFGNPRVSEQDVMREYRSKALLVIDDLGAEQNSDYNLTTIYAIIQARHDFFRPTIVTTNLTLAEIHNIEPRLASRLASFVEVKLDGEDRRLSE